MKRLDEIEKSDIMSGIIRKLSIEELELLVNPTLCHTQREEILQGFNNNLTFEQVQVYAKRKFGVKQMKEIRTGFEQGLSMEQVEIYAKENFEHQQMAEIRKGFERGLTLEQVQVYAKSKFYHFEMHEIRKSFEKGLTVEDVTSYINEDYVKMEEFGLSLRMREYEIKKWFTDILKLYVIVKIAPYAEEEKKKFRERMVKYPYIDGQTMTVIRYLLDENIMMDDIIKIIDMSLENDDSVLESLVNYINSDKVLNRVRKEN